MCVKEPALHQHEGEEGDPQQDGKIPLRKLKTIIRQRERAGKPKGEGDVRNEESEDEESEDEEHEEQVASLSLEDRPVDDDGDNDGGVGDGYDDEDDPFLKAVGGADKLVTGIAYQEKRLKEEREREQK
jgi:hypothetical protein